MADDHESQAGQQQFGTSDYILKQQAARMLDAIQKGYSDNFQNQESPASAQSSNQSVVATLYMNHQAQQQQGQHGQSVNVSGPTQVQQQHLQQQLQQVQQFQQMQQLAQMQQQYTSTSSNGSNVNVVLSPPVYCPMRRGRKPSDKRKRRRHTWVKRPTTAYLYFVSKYRETLKEAGEVVPKAKIITQACAEKWRNMNEEEKEPFLELSRRDRERWEKDKALEKKPRDPNRPKRPPSAYFLFLADFRKKYPGKTDPAKEITKKAGEAWNNLSDLEKTPYYQDAQVIRSKWERDLELYKQSSAVEKAESMKRTPSMDSNCDQLQIGTDSSPSHSSDLAEINPTILQESAMLGMASTSSFVEGSSQLVASSNPGHSSPGVVYPFPHQIVEKRPPAIQYPGR